MKKTIYIYIAIGFALLAILACGMNAPTPQADPNAFNTMVAETAQVQFIQMTQTALAAIQQPPAAPPTLPPTAALSDEAAIKQALLAKFGWKEADLEFSMGQNTGQVAKGSLKNINEQNGAAWFAAKDSNGQWIIVYVGHGIPNCSEIEGYNIPTDWITHCMDASGQTIERASRALPAANPPPAATTQAPPPAADIYAPDPLGPMFSSMYISNGMCYDMDILFHTTDASCDVILDSNGVLTPKNGGLFSGYATLTPPSLNNCKAAALSADPIAPNSDLYMCFKTNTGKYGFFVARQIDSGGIVFDAYVFP